MLIRVEGSRPQGLKKRTLIARYLSVLGNMIESNHLVLNLKPVHFGFRDFRGRTTLLLIRYFVE